MHQIRYNILISGADYMCVKVGSPNSTTRKSVIEKQKLKKKNHRSKIDTSFATAQNLKYARL